MKIETLYDFGDVVYHRLGEQPAGIITGIIGHPAGKAGISLRYMVSMETGSLSEFYEFELITQRTFIPEEK